jgi:integrase
MLMRFLKGNQSPRALTFCSKRGSPLHETKILHEFLHPVLKAFGLPQAGIHAFRHGCSRGWELAGINPGILRQQMGDSSAVMTARYTGEIPLEQVRTAFSTMELENMEVIGKRPRCTRSRLVAYNKQIRGMSGRRTMAV